MKVAKTRLSMLCKDHSLKEFVDEYEVPKKMNFNVYPKSIQKEKLETYDTRWKDRSKSVNARSRPKN